MDEIRKESSHPIGARLDRFIRQVDGLATTLPLVALVLDATGRDITTRLQKVQTDHGKSFTDEEGEWVVIDPEHNWQHRKLLHRAKRAQLAARTVPRSFLVSLVSAYDAFLGGLLKEVFFLCPELMQNSDRTLTLAQLGNFNDLSEARAFLVEKEIESVLRNSHAEQFDWMEKKFKLHLRKDLPSWPTFIELTERRNLFVHTDGVVSTQYVQVCSANGVALEPDVRPGFELGVPRQYFEKAYRCIFEIGVKLGHVMWRKFDDKTRADADSHLNMVGFDLIAEERYDLAITMMDFATMILKTHSEEEIRRYMVLNRAQAHKWSGNGAACTKIITDEDWSACDDLIRLGVAALMDDYSQALALMKRLGPHHNRVKKAEYRNWPIFKELRKREDFGEQFEQIFGEPLNRVEAQRSADDGASSKEKAE